jgi:hypothetical protein
LEARLSRSGRPAFHAVALLHSRLDPAVAAQLHLVTSRQIIEKGRKLGRRELALGVGRQWEFESRKSAVLAGDSWV